MTDEVPAEFRQAFLAFLREKYGSNEDAESMPRPILEAIITTLKEVAEVYQRPCPYKVGDIVTPRRGRGYVNPGWPSVVLEIADPPHRNFDEKGGPSSALYGRKLDMRIAQYQQSGEVVAYWIESVDYEPHDGTLPKEKA